MVPWNLITRKGCSEEKVQNLTFSCFFSLSTLFSFLPTVPRCRKANSENVLRADIWQSGERRSRKTWNFSTRHPFRDGFSKGDNTGVMTFFASLLYYSYSNLKSPLLSIINRDPRSRSLTMAACHLLRRQKIVYVTSCPWQENSLVSLLHSLPLNSVEHTDEQWISTQLQKMSTSLCISRHKQLTFEKSFRDFSSYSEGSWFSLVTRIPNSKC